MFERIRRTSLILLALPLLVTGCGNDKPKPGVDVDAAGGSGGSAGSGTGGSAPSGSGGSGGAGEAGASAYDAAPVPAMVPLADSPKAFASLLCEKVWTCCSREQQLKIPVSGQQECERVFTSLLGAPVEEITASMAANRVTYDGAALGTCLREYQAASCDAARPKGQLINHQGCAYLTPLVDVGGACEKDFECKAGYCAEKKCVARKAEGAACGKIEECASWCKIEPPRTCIATPDLCASL